MSTKYNEEAEDLMFELFDEDDFTKVVFRQLSKSDGYMGCSTNVQQNSFNNSGNQAG